jgi:hypothetical protein
MMHRFPPLFFLVPLEQWWIDHPTESMDAFVNELAFPANVETKASEYRGSGVFGIGNQENEIARPRLQTLGECSDLVLVQELGDGRTCDETAAVLLESQPNESLGTERACDLGKRSSCERVASAKPGTAKPRMTPPSTRTLRKTPKLVF